ncbi:M16 family metallopeptidase [Coleofasciculus chthonoplastes]|uniref:M16 family metallopeptidase n=1 Tax=Coleofasciculus chthonoplastes TaxID=64178 RepID=UPI0040648562
MPGFHFLNRYFFPLLLFTLCLSAVLLFSNTATLSQTPLSNTNSDSSLSLTETVRKTVLDNGLTVITKEIHSAPVVTVQVWYKVGSRDETPGLNGISHQLEHLMFKGTTNRPIQFGRLLSALGADSNAFTSYDQTAYYNTVQRDKLEALLILEADRMQNAQINAEQLATEKGVVISELEGYENDPGYRLDREIMRQVFPNHAYGLPVGGTKEDVEGFTLEQVEDYYRTYYRPDNATIIIVGDFETDAVLKAVNQHFGTINAIQPGEDGGVGAGLTDNVWNQTDNLPKPALPGESGGVGAGLRDNIRRQTDNLPKPAPVGEAENNFIVLEQPGSAALVQVVYPLPTVTHPDVPAIDVMDYILTSGRSSRIYQALVESGLASDAGGYAANFRDKGWYALFVTTDPGEDLNAIAQVLQEAIASLKNQGVTDAELNRAKAQLKAELILENRDVTSQGFQFGANHTTAGDYRFTDQYLAAVAQVSSQDVQRVAQAYLTPQQRTVGFFQPTQIQEEANRGIGQFSKTSEHFYGESPVDPTEVAQYLPPGVTDATLTPTQPLPERLTLTSGLQVLLLRDRSTPTVTLTGYIKAGRANDPSQKSGVAELTADNLMNGTQTQDALTLAQRLDDRGINLDFYTVREGTSISASALSPDLSSLIQTLSDVLQRATFPPDQLELSRQRALTDLQIELDDPATLAQRTLAQTLYPKNHPFHSFPTPESLSQITRDHVVQFYQTYYRPDRTILTLVGDFDPQQVRSRLEQEFGRWTATGKPPQLTVPAVKLPPSTVQVNRRLPGKSQSVTFMGNDAMNRTDPRYYAALVLNQIIGGDTLASRLGTVIRDRLGLTYGIYSYFQTGIYDGSFVIEMQTAPEDAQSAIANTITLLQQIQEQGVTATEVATAKRSITSQYPVTLAHPDNLAQTILDNQVYGLTPDELREFVRHIEAVSVKQVNQAAKELLHPDNLVIVTAGSV